MAVLPADTEVLLRKRKNADRKRIQKQEAIRIQKEKQKKKAKTPRDKFVRAEHLAMKSLAAQNEQKRLNNILKHEQQKEISSKKEFEPRLVFVMRVKTQNKALNMPRLAENVLEALRLTEVNMGVFVKLTSTVEPALRLVAPYIVVGTPSLASVRHLFQKRACIYAPREESEEQGEAKDQAEVDEHAEEPLRTVKLDNNQAVEDRFGDDLGLICIEDIIHEIVTLGDNFKAVNLWLAPFPLSATNQGFDAATKLKRIVDAEENKKPVSMAGHVKLNEVDIDKFIATQN